MPIIKSVYNPPLPFKNGHFSTIYSALLRNVKGVLQERERLKLPDGDFLDLDWSYTSTKTKKLIVVLHGLEGNAQRQYMLGTAKIFNQNNIDAVCVNFRGCSGELNLKYKSYHSGETEDLKAILNYIIETKVYDKIYLKGFSLGGNVILKYLGETSDIPNQIKSAISISAPCHLHGSMKELHTFKNMLYKNRFKKHLKQHLKLKQKQFPENMTIEGINRIKTLKDFDDIYTSKANGFKDALDYYEKSSSLHF